MVTLPTPLQKISHALLEDKEVEIYIKRDDLIHPEIMGNKWRKLKYNLKAMKEANLHKLVTMGGAFSNHIAATAAAAEAYNVEATGIIRGEELNESSNPTLRFAAEKGMKFDFVNRTYFRAIRESPELLKRKFPDHYFLPEGGTNALAIQGCEEIIPEIEVNFDVLVTPIGTGGTFAGLLNSAKDHQKILGISSLKGSFIHSEISKLLDDFHISNENYEITDTHHFGGYGKVNGELIDFINWFKEIFNISLDPIYTGKAFFGVWDMIKRDKFEKNLQIVLLHTGGIQGIEGFNRKNENIIQ